MPICGIKAEDAKDYWYFASKHLSRIDGFDADRELGLIEAGKRQLWLIVQDEDCIAAIITEVDEEPEKVVTIRNGAGESMDLWRDAFVGEVMAWGRSMGAVTTRIIGRLGWERETRELGFKRVAVILEAKNNG